MTTETRGEIRTPDGITLATAAWVPDAPKALVLLAHGHAEHLGRYGHVIAALNGRGYAVHATDHRGHGRSSGERALAMRFDDYIDDFRLMAREAQASHPGLPVVVLGHSMGGLIAARYALAWQQELTALVISGAAFTIDEGTSPVAKAAARMVAKVFPKAPVPGNNEDTLSYDPAVKAAFTADPLNYHGKTRMRTAVEMVAAGEDALRRATDLRIPLLAMHGADDKLTSPRGTERFYEQAASTDKTLTLWPHMKHEIFNEVDKDSVITYMLDWLHSHVSNHEPYATVARNRD